MKISNIPKLIEYTNEKLKDVDFNEGLYEVDFIVNANCDYLDNLIFDLDGGKYLWGQGCEEPMLAVENITLKKSDIAIIGSNKDTLRFTFNGITYIQFKAKELIDKINSYTEKINITVVGRGNINVWGGRQTPQILIDEIDISNCDINSF